MKRTLANWRIVTALVAVTAAPAGAAAQEAKPVTVTGDVGFVNTAGNTDVTTLNVAERLVLRAVPWIFSQTFGVVYGRSGGATTTSLWKGATRLDYKIGARVRVFARGAYERNTFAGIRWRFEEAAGLAATLVEDSRNRLGAELGSSLNQQRSTSGVTSNFAAGRVATSYRRNLTDAAFVEQDVEVLPNFKDTDDVRLNSETELVAPLSRRIALKLSYVLRFDNAPEAGFRKTDRLFTSGVQIVF